MKILIVSAYGLPHIGGVETIVAAGDSVDKPVRARKVGNEFGATTGRPRRTGWMDVLALRYAARVNGLDGLAMMKLDVLTGFSEVKIGVQYRAGGTTFDEMPSDPETLERCTPVYETLPGWTESLDHVQRFEDLPETTRRYIARVEELANVPVIAVSLGADRARTILRENPFTVPTRARR